MASISSTKPRIETSPTLPGRMKREYTPISSAIGIVAIDREGAPRAVGQRLDDDQRQHGEQDHHDHEGAEQRDHAGDQAELGADQLAERAAVAAHRDEQDHEVLHRAGEDHAGQDPEQARQVAHLRGEHGADQRAGAGDGREMVAEQHVAVGRDVVEPVVVAIGRRLRGAGSSRITCSAM